MPLPAHIFQTALLLTNMGKGLLKNEMYQICSKTPQAGKNVANIDLFFCCNSMYIFAHVYC